ncbi:acyltransferase domain-containing protein, partial [Actinocrinis puniceicyclus]
HHTHYTQPALFTLETALYRLTQTFGIQPDYLTGHSLGEITAAHTAGILTLPDAVTLVAHRARLMQQTPTGAMHAINATEEQVRHALQGHEHHTAIAAINGPTHTVISGDTQTTNTIAQHFAAQGHKTRRLNTHHAFHSPHTVSYTHL